MIIQKQFDIKSLSPIDHPPLVRVVLYYLKQYGIIEFNSIDHLCYYEDIESLLQEAGFKEKGYLDKLIVHAWSYTKKSYPSITFISFAYDINNHYHNYRLEQYASKATRNRNRKIENKYFEFVRVINGLQGYLDSSELRLRIDSNYVDRETIYQCLTPFCTISVNCDELGNFSIKYALAPDIRSMITDLLASILEKRISDTQMTDLKDYVKPTLFTNEFKDRFITRVEENSIPNKGFKKDFPIYVLRNKF